MVACEETAAEEDECEEVATRLGGGGLEASSSSESDKVKSTATTLRLVPDIGNETRMRVSGKGGSWHDCDTQTVLGRKFFWQITVTFGEA